MHPNFRSNLRCPYYQINSFMIDPDLKLYKCSLYIGEDEKSIGYISQDNSHFLLQDKESFIKAINTSPFDNEECVNCKVLPLCFGKCPILWENADKAHDEGCIPEKTTIVSKIRNLYNL
ncbi:MAG: SPASM domain-containing protein [Salinivirgaceae bacterium]|nr:SPASM domain-containing protein [Salinivirgaceae bacterium]